MGDGADDAREAEELAEMEAATAAEPEAQPEVTAAEFAQGIAEPVGQSALSEEVVEALRKPLDPNRIRRRKGRGAGQFEYIAGHDVKRRANEIFGFGNWGSELVDLAEIGAVEVKGSQGGAGWHVGYRAIVRVTVRGAIPVSDVGYGDGVEYGPAAFVTARELAMKEASTDALKRALTQMGDQFGLILYAKQDERQRIERESNAEQATSAVANVRQNQAGRVETPRTWAEIFAWAEPYGPELGWAEWVKDASELLFKTRERRELSAANLATLGQKASGAVIALREKHDPSAVPPPSRKDVQDAWASVIDGLALPGPLWRMSPAEEDRPPWVDPDAKPVDEARARELAEAEGIPFGEGP